MATTIGKLVVSLTTRTSKFRKGMKASIGRVASFASGIGGAIKKVAKFTAIITTAAVAGIAFFTKKAFESIDATAKLARQVGISIDGLRGLNRAAKITGATAADVTKAVGVFGKMIGEAAVKGIGLAKDALDVLRLSAKDLIKLPVDEAIAIIADEMNMLGTQAEKAFVASKLFGRGGLALVNTLALGSKGLREMTEGAILLQGSLSAFDAAKVEEANDAVSDLRDTWTGFFERIAVETAPAVKAAADNVTKTLIFLRRNSGTIVPQVLGWFKGLGETTVLVIDTIVEEVSRIPDSFEVAALMTVEIWDSMLADMEAGTEIWLADFTTGLDAIGTAGKLGFEGSAVAVGGFFAKTTASIQKFLLDNVDLNERARKSIEKGLLSTQILAGASAAKIADISEKALTGFIDRTAKKTGNLKSRIAEIRQEAEAVRKALREKQAGLLGKGKGFLAGAIDKIIAGIQDIKLPTLGDDLEASLVDGGKGAADAISKAIRGPAAIEKGTVEAFSATVQPTFRAMSDNSKSTVAELKENNRLQREGNRQFQAWAGGAVVTLRA